jgi:uncharacterized protein YehS (DUF1456 family)
MILYLKVSAGTITSLNMEKEKMKDYKLCNLKFVTLFKRGMHKQTRILYLDKNYITLVEDKGAI